MRYNVKTVGSLLNILVKFLFALSLLVFGHFLVSLSRLVPTIKPKIKRFIPKPELNRNCSPSAVRQGENKNTSVIYMPGGTSRTRCRPICVDTI